VIEVEVSYRDILILWVTKKELLNRFEWVIILARFDIVRSWQLVVDIMDPNYLLLAFEPDRV
jgi:hypothetical protein